MANREDQWYELGVIGGFTKAVVITGVEEGDIIRLRQMFGDSRVFKASQWSHNNEIVYVDSFDEVEHMNSDDKHAFKKLMEVNYRE